MIAVLLCVGFTIAVFVSVMKNQPPPPKNDLCINVTLVPKKAKPKAKAKAVPKAKPKADPLLAAAKAAIVSLGYPASEASKLLQGITATTVESYVSQAMKKVKI